MARTKPDAWVPKVATTVDWGAATLTPEDMFVLSRVDGSTNVDHLVHLTGLNREQLDGALERLSVAGVLMAPEEKPAAEDFDVPDTDPGTVPDMPEAAAVDQPAGRRATVPDGDTVETALDGAPDDEGDEAQDPLPPDGELRTLAAEEANHRKLYETVLRPLSKDQRLALAKTETGNSLMALCLDPDAQVIAAVMENDAVGLPHARLIAFHHRTSTGLEALAKRSAFLTHREVQRLLLANPMLGEGLFNRVLSQRRLKDIHKVVVSRDVPEKTKVRARGMLRQKFTARDPEERADLILSTEGRCLTHLVGVNVDAKTAAVMTRRQVQSALLVSNIARFPGTPAVLLLHLLKQPLVARSPGLKVALLQHPNTPSDAKRRGGAT